MRTHTPLAPSSAWRTIRENLRAGRQARAFRRHLEIELSSYRSPSQIYDLLGMIGDQDTPEADVVRDVLTQNLSHYSSANRLA